MNKGFLHETYYDVLNLPRNCSQEDIKNAFIELSKKYHPDKQKNDSHNKYVKILEAYKVLKKPKSRAEYDLGLSGRHANVNNFTPRARKSNVTEYYYADPVQRAWDDPSFWKNRRSSHLYRQPPSKTLRQNFKLAFAAIIVIYFITLQYIFFRENKWDKNTIKKKNEPEE